MVDPTFLSEDWKNKDGAAEPPAYCSPSLIYRLNDENTTAPDKGVQMLVIPEGNGLYALGRLEFTLPHHAKHRSDDPETLSVLERGLKPEDAITKAFAQMGRELETAKYCETVTPQARKHRTPVDIPDAQPLAKLPALAITPDRAGLQAIFQRLSSQWGKKTTNYQDIPSVKRTYADYLWS